MITKHKDCPSPFEVKGVRQRAKLTQEWCAERMNVTLKTWQRWENDRSIMPHYAWWYFKNEVKTNAVNEVNYVDPIQEMAEDWGS
tara:strand:- start:308 stop:562 length:255 start_codon:yes stop_codon:yes gene_type:complete